MRFLHTADWHLGQLFYEYDRTAEHEAFLAWLLDTIGAERADALLVAGDIFDHANPSAASQKQLYRFLSEARRRHPQLNLVLIAGNHDSPGRMEAPSPLLAAFDVTVVGQVARRDDGSIDTGRLCVPLRDGSGEVAAWCLAIPFLRSADLPSAGAELAAAPTNDHYAAGVARLYHAVLAAALSRREPDQAIVALTHCHVEGGALSAESERAVVAGGLDAISRHVFDPRLAYVALGHLHCPQTMAGDERLRYSGSPLPLSFSEIDYPHQVVCVDLDSDRVAGVREIRVPRFVDILRLSEEPAPTNDVLAALEAIDLPEVEAGRRPYLEVRVRLDGPEPGLRARIDEALAAKPVRLARIETSYAHAAAEPGAVRAASLDDLARLTPADVFKQLYRDRFADDAPVELLSAFGELLRVAEAEGR
jgi:DNA repair protein SbcD/Mre11